MPFLNILRSFRACVHVCVCLCTRMSHGWIKHMRTSLCIYDMIEYSSVVFMFKVYNNQFPRHLLCFFDRVYDSHNHNTRTNVNNFKIKYCRTSQKASCISVIGPNLRIIYTQICNVANRFLVLKPTIKERYSKDTNICINYHSTYHLLYIVVHTCMFRHFFVFKLYFECTVPTWQLHLYNYNNAACL